MLGYLVKTVTHSDSNPELYIMILILTLCLKTIQLLLTKFNYRHLGQVTFLQYNF